jgi:hypothetical protein
VGGGGVCAGGSASFFLFFWPPASRQMAKPIFENVNNKHNKEIQEIEALSIHTAFQAAEYMYMSLHVSACAFTRVWRCVHIELRKTKKNTLILT